METDNLSQNISYNQAIQEIEKLLREMQSDNCDIDLLAANTKKAAMLIDLCRKRLLQAEKEVQSILSDIPSIN